MTDRFKLVPDEGDIKNTDPIDWVVYEWYHLYMMGGNYDQAVDALKSNTKPIDCDINFEIYPLFDNSPLTTNL